MIWQCMRGFRQKINPLTYNKIYALLILIEFSSVAVP